MQVHPEDARQLDGAQPRQALADANFYTLEEDGVRLVDWLNAQLAGQDVDSVRCADWVVQ